MTRRMIAVVLATAVLALLLAAAAPRAEAVSFVDKQVQAGALLIQNYVNTYGQAHQFVYPPKSMVKKGGGLPDATLIWPSNPWTGKIMGPGTSRGTYTYTLGAGGRSYKLTVHLSSGNYVLTSGDARRGSRPSATPPPGRTCCCCSGTSTPTRTAARRLPGDRLADPGQLPGPTYVWPKNPWTGADMAASDGLGDFSYARRQRDRLHAQGQADDRLERSLRPGRAPGRSLHRRPRAADLTPGGRTLRSRFRVCLPRSSSLPPPQDVVRLEGLMEVQGERRAVRAERT